MSFSETWLLQVSDNMALFSFRAYASGIAFNVIWLRMKNPIVSERGVVFFRKQDDLDNDLQKELAQRLGQLSGKPSTSGLHIHPVVNAGRERGGNDDEISVIDSEQAKKLFKGYFGAKKQTQRQGWHSDITFEPVPSDYAILRLTQIPRTGGGKITYKSKKL